jgi:hypothetical protein
MTEQEAVEKLQAARARLHAAGHKCGKDCGSKGGWKTEGAYQTAAYILDNTYEEVASYLPSSYAYRPKLKRKYRIRGKAPQK